MVSRQVKLNRLISWSRNFDVDIAENILRLIFYVGADGGDYTGALGDKEYHVKPNTATVTRLKKVRDQIISLLENTVLIEGTILETHEVKEVTIEAITKLALVKV